MANQTQNALATRRQQTGNATVADLIKQQIPGIAAALPKHMNADRMARIALTELRRTPELQKCKPESLLAALMQASQLGVEPGPLGEAYLVPFAGNVTLIVGYRGYLKLAWQSGQLKSIAAHVVHEKDEFDYAYGLEPKLHHKPNLKDRGPMIAVYAAAVFKDGGNAFVVLSAGDVDAIKTRAKAKDSGPWKTDTKAMWRKTAIRQLARWLPMSAELNNATAADNQTHTGYQFTDDQLVIDSTADEDVTADPVTGEVIDQPATEEPPWPDTAKPPTP